MTEPRDQESKNEVEGLWKKHMDVNDEEFLIAFRDISQGLALCEIICDDSGRPYDYRFLQANKGFQTHTGLDPEDILGKTALEILPILETDWIETFGKVALTGNPFIFENYNHDTQKYYQVFAFSPAKGKFIMLFSDISEPKIVEMERNRLFEELQRRTAEQEAILSTMMTGVGLFDSRGRIIRFNSAAMKILGFTDNDLEKTLLQRIRLIGLENEDGIPVLPKDTVLERVLKGETVRDLPFRFYRNREIRWVLISGSPIQAEDGELFGAVLNIIDITEQKQREIISQSLNQINELIHSSLDFNKTMSRVLSEATKAIDCETAAISLYRGIYWEVTYVHGFPDDVIGSHMDDHQESHAVLAINTKKIVAIDDAFHDQRVNGEHMRKWQIRSVMVVPIISEGRSIGVIFFNYHRDIFHFNDFHIDFGNKLATILSLALDKTHLIKKLQIDLDEQNKTEKTLRIQQEELTAANQQLQTQQEELIAQQDELTAQQEELTAINEELLAQTEELNKAYLELQHQSEEIQTHAAAASVARDKAERHAAELNATIAAIAAGVIIYDEQGNIRLINETAQNIFDYSPEDCNLSFLERFEKYRFYQMHSEKGLPYQYEETPLYRALQGQTIVDEELKFIRDPDQTIWLSGTYAPIFNDDQSLIGVIAIYTDISQRKQRIENLLASERELLKVTLNSIGEGVMAVDQQGYVIFLNKSAANLIGHIPEEAIGKPFEKIFYLFNDKTSEPVDFRIPNLANNLMILSRELKEVPISLSSSPIKTMDGQVIGTVAVFQDITEKLKTQQELSKADKLESLGILAGGIAHDFNNILGAILSNVQLAIMKMEKSQDIRKYLLNTVETTRKASNLTKQLLTFSKGGAPVRKDCSLVDLIRDTVEFALRGAKVKAEFMISDNLWFASIDEGQISQVLNNMVINAEQAMPKGGVIQVIAENIVLGDDFGVKPGNYVKISVKDQGIGIPKENLSKIFDPFFTTKKDGNGLGLATSYSIIRHHEGFMEVESQEGAGTTFYIYLPASSSSLVIPNPKKGVTASGKGLKILLMDDEENILHAVGEMLMNYGYQVVLTVDGDKAILAYQEALKNGMPFDAVIVDLTVPGGKGGQEVIAYLRDFDPKIKAIVSSGYADDLIIADYERFGFKGVVSKPYKIEELNKVLQKVLNPEQLPLDLNY